jgi:cytidine deaminase
MGEKEESSFSYQVYESRDALLEEEKELFRAAGEALRHSYSPYSRFPVGAALLLDDGGVVRASNQENAAFPSGICAERVAVWKAATEAPDKGFRTLALTTQRESGKAPVSPCGACRQVLSEYEERAEGDLRVLFPGANGSIIAVNRARDLLPFPFQTASLRNDDEAS